MQPMRVADNGACGVVVPELPTWVLPIAPDLTNHMRQFWDLQDWNHCHEGSRQLEALLEYYYPRGAL